MDMLKDHAFVQFIAPCEFGIGRQQGTPHRQAQPELARTSCGQLMLYQLDGEPHRIGLIDLFVRAFSALQSNITEFISLRKHRKLTLLAERMVASGAHRASSRSPTFSPSAVAIVRSSLSRI
jgi:hypothetical protein